MAVKQTWPDIFSRALPKRTDILKMDYLVSIFPDGRLYCKPCGRFVTGNQEEHYKSHVKEFVAWEKEKEREAKAAAAQRLRDLAHERALERKVSVFMQTVPEIKLHPMTNKFYHNPCQSCGAKIPHSGKRGQPPKRCAGCKSKKK